MDGLRTMRVFRRVIEVGGITAAATELRLGQASVSRIVAELERRLGAQLLHRGPPLVPTEAGRTYYAECVALLDRLEDAETAIRVDRNEVGGRLRVACRSGFGQWALVPLLPPFLERHPGLALELLLEERPSNLVREGIDIAVRLGPLDGAGDVIARRLGTVRFGLFAAPSYLARRGAAREPDDLASHEACLFLPGQTGTRLKLVGPGGRRAEARPGGRLWSNSAEALRQSAIAGLGLALLPVGVARHDIAAGRLERVLPGWEAPPVPVAAIWPATRYLPRRTRAFVDYLAGALRELLPAEP
jgi:DNA-binding transcriptional LysR family regulator